MRSKPDTLPLLVFGDGKLERRAPEVRGGPAFSTSLQPS